MNELKLYGLTIKDGTLEEYINYIFDNLNQGKKTHIITLNSLMLLKTLVSKKYKNIVKNAELVFIDGFGVELAFKMLGIKVNKRIAGIDFFTNLLYYIDYYNKSLYLLGGSFEVVNIVEKNIKLAYPSIRIVGRYQGYYKKEEEIKISTAIKKASPDFIAVSLGFPKQEYWIYKNKDTIKVAIGLGGSFDIFAGKRKRAPKFFIDNNFEWLYRIFTIPGKLFLIFPLFLYFLIISFYSIFYHIKRLFTKKIKLLEKIYDRA